MTSTPVKIGHPNVKSLLNGFDDFIDSVMFDAVCVT